MAAPTVTGVNPTSGAPGFTVAITGTNFTGATAVLFGTTPAVSFTVTGPTTITAEAPLATGTVDITVTTPSGTSATSVLDQFTFTAQPFPLPLPDSLGAMVGADDVRDAVKATVDLWSPYYVGIVSQRLAAAGRIGGAGQNPNPLPNFGTWVNEPSFRSIGTGQPAAYLVTVSGTVGKPHLQGNGQTLACYRAQVQVQTFGTSWQEAADLTSWYAKAVRWSVGQHRSLGGFANNTAWIGESYSAVEHSSSRTEGRVVVGFDVTIGDVMDVNRGPATVPGGGGPPTQDPTVETVIVDLTKYPDTQPLP